MKYGNITTQEITDNLPTSTGPNNFNASIEQLRQIGWREISVIDEKEGYRITKQGVEDIDGIYCRITVTDSINLAEEQAQQQAQQQATYEQDLIANAQRYVYENAFLMLCDQLTVQTTHNKLTIEAITLILLQIKATNRDLYEDLRDFVNMVNSALIRFDVLWWDSCTWREVPTIIQGAQQLINLLNQ